MNSMDVEEEVAMDDAKRFPARSGLVLATVCVCQLMVVLDISVVNVALPSIARDLDFSAGELSWVVNAYTLVFGGLLLLGGRVADLVGHRVAVFVALGLFGLTSIIGGVAQNPGELIAARAGQGLAAAVLAPLTLTILMVNFAEGPARNRAVSLWATVAAAGSAVGVLLGGVLTEWLSWRWVLFINVPIVAVALLLAARSVRDRRTVQRPRLDVAGAVLVTIAVTALVNGTIQAGEHSWGSTSSWMSLVVALVAGAIFAWWETRVRAPLVRFGVFALRTVWVANVIVVFIGATTVAGFYFASLLLQDVLHYSPIQAGAAFLPFCCGTVLGAMGSSRLAARFGVRAVMTVGLVLGATGMFLFSRISTASTFTNGFLLPSVIASVGIGMAMVTNTSLATTGIPPHEAGLVSGLINAARQCGGSLGLAVLATVAVATTRGSTSKNPVGAIIDGYDRAFQVTAGFTLIAAIVAVVFVPAVRTKSSDGVDAPTADDPAASQPV